MSSDFSAVSNVDVARFIGAFPLSWIVPIADPGDAILMPVMLEQAADGRPARLIGHLPKRSDAAHRLKDQTGAVFLMLGANSYISPAAAGKSDWAPTWNFVSMKIEGEVELDEDFTKEAVERLVAQQEQYAETPWTTTAVAHRYEKLLSAVIGFRAHIRQITPRFKTGQDEAPDVYERIQSALMDHPLRDWMS